jgi:hypothetical protein
MELSQGAANWLAKGNDLIMVTLTAPHYSPDRLDVLWDAMAKGWRSMLQGKRWLGFKADFQVVGVVRALEVTVGRHGWHPHLHVLVFVTGRIGEHRRSGMEGWFQARWADVVKRQLGRQVGANGVHVSAVGSGAAGAYVAKVQDDLGDPAGGWDGGSEMTRHDLKQARRSGVTPFGLLEQIEVAEGRDRRRLVAKWREWERVSKGRRALTWSVGLRDLLGLDAEASDEDLVEEDEHGDLAGFFDRSLLWALEARGRTADMLTAVERGQVANGLDGARRSLRDFLLGFAMLEGLPLPEVRWEG